MTIKVSPILTEVKAYVLETSQSTPCVFIDDRKLSSIVNDRLGRLSNFEFRELRKRFKKVSANKQQVKVGEKDWISFYCVTIRCESQQITSKLRELGGSVII